MTATSQGTVPAEAAIPCPHEGCTRSFTNERGLARHLPSHAPDKVCPCGWKGRNLVVHQEKEHGISGETTKAFAATADALVAALKREGRLKLQRDRDARKLAERDRQLAEARAETAAIRLRLDTCLAGDTTAEETHDG